jgi:hypothetical protein
MKLPPSLMLFAVLFAPLWFGVACSTRTDPTPTAILESRTAAPEDNGGESMATHLPAAFSVSRVDWSEAQRVLGYPIVKSTAFVLTWPYLFVQPAIESGESIPRKAVGLYSIDGIGVRVTVAPETTWNDGALQRGTQLAIDGRRGWLQSREAVINYAFPCGSSAEFGEVWCQVEMNSSSTDLLTRFVVSLAPAVEGP